MSLKDNGSVEGHAFLTGVSEITCTCVPRHHMTFLKQKTPWFVYYVTDCAISNLEWFSAFLQRRCIGRICAGLNRPSIASSRQELIFLPLKRWGVKVKVHVCGASWSIPRSFNCGKGFYCVVCLSARTLLYYFGGIMVLWKFCCSF
jgi:hypothetical protein